VCIADQHLPTDWHRSRVGLGYALGQIELRLGLARTRLAEIRQLLTDGGDPNRRELDQVRRVTGVRVDPNPYFGLTQHDLEAALRASEDGVASVPQPPEVLLALWSKEGSLRTQFRGVRVPADIAHLSRGGRVTTVANARVLIRSFIYWTDMRSDHFVHSPPGALDSRPILNDTMVADHDRRFTNAIQQLVMGGPACTCAHTNG
jgi:hypothetical protein